MELWECRVLLQDSEVLMECMALLQDLEVYEGCKSLQKDSNLIPRQQKESQAKSGQEIERKALWKIKQEKKTQKSPQSKHKNSEFFNFFHRLINGKN